MNQSKLIADLYSFINHAEAYGSPGVQSVEHFSLWLSRYLGKVADAYLNDPDELEPALHWLSVHAYQAHFHRGITRYDFEREVASRVEFYANSTYTDSIGFKDLYIVAGHLAGAYEYASAKRYMALLADFLVLCRLFYLKECS
jgi:hypothetical protein